MLCGGCLRYYYFRFMPSADTFSLLSVSSCIFCRLAPNSKYFLRRVCLCAPNSRNYTDKSDLNICATDRTEDKSASNTLQIFFLAKFRPTLIYTSNTPNASRNSNVIIFGSRFDAAFSSVRLPDCRQKLLQSYFQPPTSQKRMLSCDSGLGFVHSSFEAFVALLSAIFYIVANWSCTSITFCRTRQIFLTDIV